MPSPELKLNYVIALGNECIRRSFGTDKPTCLVKIREQSPALAFTANPTVAASSDERELTQQELNSIFEQFVRWRSRHLGGCKVCDGSDIRDAALIEADTNDLDRGRKFFRKIYERLSPVDKKRFEMAEQCVVTFDHEIHGEQHIGDFIASITTLRFVYETPSKTIKLTQEVYQAQRKRFLELLSEPEKLQEENRQAFNDLCVEVNATFGEEGIKRLLGDKSIPLFKRMLFDAQCTQAFNSSIFERRLQNNLHGALSTDRQDYVKAYLFYKAAKFVAPSLAILGRDRLSELIPESNTFNAWHQLAVAEVEDAKCGQQTAQGILRQNFSSVLAALASAINDGQPTQEFLNQLAFLIEVGRNNHPQVIKTLVDDAYQGFQQQQTAFEARVDYDDRQTTQVRKALKAFQVLGTEQKVSSTKLAHNVMDAILLAKSTEKILAKKFPQDQDEAELAYYSELEQQALAELNALLKKRAQREGTEHRLQILPEHKQTLEVVKASVMALKDQIRDERKRQGTVVSRAEQAIVAELQQRLTEVSQYAGSMGTEQMLDTTGKYSIHSVAAEGGEGPQLLQKWLQTYMSALAVFKENSKVKAAAQGLYQCLTYLPPDPSQQYIGRRREIVRERYEQALARVRYVEQTRGTRQYEFIIHDLQEWCAFKELLLKQYIRQDSAGDAVSESLPLDVNEQHAQEDYQAIGLPDDDAKNLAIVEKLVYATNGSKATPIARQALGAHARTRENPQAGLLSYGGALDEGAYAIATAMATDSHLPLRHPQSFSDFMLYEVTPFVGNCPEAVELGANPAQVFQSTLPDTAPKPVTPGLCALQLEALQQDAAGVQDVSARLPQGRLTSGQAVRVLGDIRAIRTLQGQDPNAGWNQVLGNAVANYMRSEVATADEKAVYVLIQDAYRNYDFIIENAKDKTPLERHDDYRMLLHYEQETLRNVRKAFPAKDQAPDWVQAYLNRTKRIIGHLKLLVATQDLQEVLDDKYETPQARNEAIRKFLVDSPKQEIQLAEYIKESGQQAEMFALDPDSNQTLTNILGRYGSDRDKILDLYDALYFQGKDDQFNAAIRNFLLQPEAHETLQALEKLVVARRHREPGTWDGVRAFFRRRPNSDRRERELKALDRFEALCNQARIGRLSEAGTVANQPDAQVTVLGVLFNTTEVEEYRKAFPKAEDSNGLVETGSWQHLVAISLGGCFDDVFNGDELCATRITTLLADLDRNINNVDPDREWSLGRFFKTANYKRQKAAYKKLVGLRDHLQGIYDQHQPALTAPYIVPAVVEVVPAEVMAAPLPEAVPDAVPAPVEAAPAVVEAAPTVTFPSRQPGPLAPPVQLELQVVALDNPVLWQSLILKMNANMKLLELGMNAQPPVALTAQARIELSLEEAELLQLVTMRYLQETELAAFKGHRAKIEYIMKSKDYAKVLAGGQVEEFPCDMHDMVRKRVTQVDGLTDKIDQLILAALGEGEQVTQEAKIRFYQQVLDSEGAVVGLTEGECEKIRSCSQVGRPPVMTPVAASCQLQLQRLQQHGYSCLRAEPDPDDVTACLPSGAEPVTGARAVGTVAKLDIQLLEYLREYQEVRPVVAKDNPHLQATHSAIIRVLLAPVIEELNQPEPSEKQVKELLANLIQQLNNTPALKSLAADVIPTLWKMFAEFGCYLTNVEKHGDGIEGFMGLTPAESLARLHPSVATKQIEAKVFPHRRETNAQAQYLREVACVAIRFKQMIPAQPLVVPQMQHADWVARADSAAALDGAPPATVVGVVVAVGAQPVRPGSAPPSTETREEMREADRPSSAPLSGEAVVEPAQFSKDGHHPTGALACPALGTSTATAVQQRLATTPTSAAASSPPRVPKPRVVVREGQGGPEANTLGTGVQQPGQRQCSVTPPKKGGRDPVLPVGTVTPTVGGDK